MRQIGLIEQRYWIDATVRWRCYAGVAWVCCRCDRYQSAGRAIAVRLLLTIDIFMVGPVLVRMAKG